MKITEMLKIVDANWIRKPKGFRVRFQKREAGGWVTDYMPEPEADALDSDVVAWRSAWKLLQSSRPGEGEFVNLTVVDDQDRPVRYYATGRVEVYNPREEAAGEISAETPMQTPPETDETDTEESIPDKAIFASEAQPGSEESNK